MRNLYDPPELAKAWILHEFPCYDIQCRYVLFKPLGHTALDENIRAVIFPVNPVELSGLITLAGSVMQGADPVRAPQGTDCCSISAFAYSEAESATPRAVLGMLGIDGREVMRRHFRDDILTLTLPSPLFHRMEQEADDCVFTSLHGRNWLGVDTHGVQCVHGYLSVCCRYTDKIDWVRSLYVARPVSSAAISVRGTMSSLSI